MQFLLRNSLILVAALPKCRGADKLYENSVVDLQKSAPCHEDANMMCEANQSAIDGDNESNAAVPKQFLV